MLCFIGTLNEMLLVGISVDDFAGGNPKTHSDESLYMAAAVIKFFSNYQYHT